MGRIHDVPLSALADERNLCPATREAGPTFALYRCFLPYKYKDTKKNVLKQDFTKKIWNIQKKYLSLQRERNLFRVRAPFGSASDLLK